MSDGIAIVGMACRYADARSPAELWETVLARRRAFRRIPAERLRLEDYLGDGPDGLYSTEAAVLEGWEFDRVRFRVAGSTYRTADLAHWLALDVADQALADAGFPEGRGLPREAAGVLLGNSLTGEFSRAGLLRLRWPYVRRVLAASLAAEGGFSEERLAGLLDRLETAYKAPFPAPTEESLAGGLSNTIAGRISNHFDLHGGGYTVDGACASSLLAVANACSALTAGDLDLALAGGVDLSLDPFELVGFARTGALAPDEMRVYDARSAGFIPGEGCGLVVLMREGEARAAGRRIYAVIRGWGVSSDGHGGISRPEAQGQLLALRRAYRRAGFGIETVAYFEGHGTGTAVGDATELKALSLARSEPGPGAPPAAVGSVKANIGHTKAAAGVAGLIKAATALDRQVLPPTTGCDEPHPELAAGGLEAPPEGRAWPAGRPLRAGVSAMGFGGINAHLVLEGAAAARRHALSSRERGLLASAQDAELLLLAAPDAAGLAREVERLLAIAPRLSRAELGDLAAELGRRLGDRPGGRVRAAVVADHPRQLAERLGALAGWLAAGVESRLAPRQGLFLGGAVTASPRLGFLFPGQGSPAHLGGGLWRRRFEAVAELYAAAGLPATGDGVDTGVAQPAIVAHEVAGLALLERLGVRGVVGLGHSLGEIAALAWAGALDGEPAVRLAAARGAAMSGLAGGAMASLGAGPAVVRELIAGSPLVIAALNAPGRTVVSGPAAALEPVLERARRRGVATTRLKVSHAFHSPLVEAAAPLVGAALADLPLRPLTRPVASTVTGGLLPADADLRDLLQRQVTSPVRFAEALAAVRGLADLWVEVGPGHSLADLAEGQLEVPVLSLDAGGPSLAGLLAVAGAAFALGAPIDASALFEGRFTRPFDPDRPLAFLAGPCELAPLDQLPIARAADAGMKDDEDGPLPVVREAPDAGPLSHLEVVRRLVAERAELPPDAVKEGSRLLSDLHLNSISVGQLVTEAARRLGLKPPASPTDYAAATVAEVARALAEQAAAGGAAGEEPAGPPAGVDAWVSAFTVELVERPLPRRGPPRAAGPLDAAPWRIVAPPGHPLAAPLAHALDGTGGGVVLCLPAAPGDVDVDLFLAAARAVLGGEAPGRLVLVGQGGGGAGFARTLHLEAPRIATRVVDLPLDHPEAAAWVAAEARATLEDGEGYAEARYDDQGVRRAPVWRRLPELREGAEGPETPADTAGLPLGPGDVLLVSGGGKGIAAECALSLALASGARLALLGRSDPAVDAELAGNLERMATAGARPLYVRADVTDAAAVRAAVERVESELGTVTALLHGAGTNVPRLLSDLDREAFLATLAPKVRGAENLLAAVDQDRLELFVTFGSIIAETGLHGEADYAVANERLARLTRELARRRPRCRCLALEWSVWSGVGMGERLGRLESLIRQGITPIPPDAGIAMLHRLLARPLPAVSVVVAGRFGEPPTVEVERPELPLLRFLETPRVHYPGIELVVDSELSADTDPYLADHVFGGEALFPAVLGLEAMAQAAMALLGTAELPVFEGVELKRPVAVPAGRSVTVRVAALARGPGRVEVVLRESSTGFAADCFRALCRFDLPRPAGAVRGAPPRRLPLEPLRDLYGGVLFHGGRFRRLGGYRQLSATECLADISPDGATTWFGLYLPGDLVLGDPAARDAAIHGIQACIPQATLLPIAAERIWSARIGSTEPLFLAARERLRQGDTFVYDVEVLGADGSVRERWEGLALRAVAPTLAPESWAAALLAPYAERRLADLIPGAGVSVALAANGGNGHRRAASDAVLERLAGRGHALHRRPDGRPDPAGGGGEDRVSVAHAGKLVLAVARRGLVGCDLEPVAERPEQAWRDLLGAERFALAELIARERREGRDAAATRVWAAAESLKKAGAPHGAPLVLEAGTEDGWLLLRSGELLIGTLLAPVRELGRPAVLAVLAEGTRAGL